MEFTIPRYLAVLDYDGDATYVKMLHFLVAGENFNLKLAVINACTDFCNTDGTDIYLANCCCFNWGDFDAYIPDEICRKHGFMKVASHDTVERAFFNDHLVKDAEILSSQLAKPIVSSYCYIFPPLDGDYHIWNYTGQWLTEYELRRQDKTLIIHKRLEDATNDNRIRKDTDTITVQEESRYGSS